MWVVRGANTFAAPNKRAEKPIMNSVMNSLGAPTRATYLPPKFYVRWIKYRIPHGLASLFKIHISKLEHK